MPFKQGFFWGAATAAYQIEGAAREDGKGASIWDMFARHENAIWKNQNADVACDHYHQYKEDVALMKQIGLTAYRLSVSWPRVLPDGTGLANAKGLDFYDRLVDELLQAGITPFVTLFHWDFPYALYNRGGWLNPQSPDWFADYARVVTDKLSDRVRHWMTLNEPQSFVSHHQGVTYAPGNKLGWKDVLQVAHHTLLAHGKAVQAIRANCRRPALVGMAPTGVAFNPASDSPADIQAARAATFAVDKKTLWTSAWWTDPVFLGRYPEDGMTVFGADAPTIHPGDLATMAQPLDFCGMNVYLSETVRAGQDGKPEVVAFPINQPLTAFRWPVTPESLYWAPVFFYERYKKPIYITENGVCNMDWVALDGGVHDPSRIDFMNRYLLALARAVRDGVDVGGYFAWTCMDNFEWSEGFKERHGLIYVNFETQQRILKDSARWYHTVIATNGRSLKPAGDPAP